LNSLQDIVDALDGHCEPPHFLWGNCWNPYVSWAAYLSEKEGGLSHCIMHNAFDYALKQTEPPKTILFSESQNKFGIYYHLKK